MNYQMCFVNDQETLEKCLEIRKKVFIEEQHVPIEIERDEFDQLTEKCHHFIILIGEQAVGTIRVKLLPNNNIQLQRFCLLKEYRKKGIGGQVLFEIENYYKAKGMKKIIFDAQCHAIPLYLACGYHEVSNVFLEAGIEHKKMEKEI